MMDIARVYDEISGRFIEQKVSIEEFVASMQINVTDKEVISGVDRLLYNHCLNKSDIRKAFNISNTKLDPILDRLINEKRIGEPITQGLQKLFDRFSVQELMTELNVPTYSDMYEKKVISVQNQKGGTGKSTTTITLANRIALDLGLNANVCVIDLDPQGSLIQHAQKIADGDIVLTMVDILIRNLVPREESRFYLYREAELLSDEELVLEAACNSHLPNLNIFMAFPNDEVFSDIFHSYGDDKLSLKQAMIDELNDFVIPILKKHYDLIFIDTPPQDSPLTWSAMTAANFILMPITPHQLDFNASGNYIEYQRDRVTNMPSLSKNIEFFKAVVVNKKLDSAQDERIHNRLIDTFGSHLASNVVLHSELFLSSSASARTIYDIQKKEAKDEGLASMAAFSDARDSFEAFYREFTSNLKTIASKKA